MAIRTLAQLRAVPQPVWYWRGFIIPKGFTLFSAYPKVGKTTMIFHMLRSLMNEEGFLDRETRRVPILYISEEADTLLAARADYMGFLDEWPIGWLTKEPGLTWERVITHMKRWVFLYPEGCIIFVDTLARFWNCESENDATQVDHALNPVLDVVRNSNAAFVGIHHNRKGGGGGGTAVRGSTALTGGVDIIMELTRIGQYDHSNVRRLNCESRYSETPSALQLRLNNGVYEAEDMEAIELEPTIIAMLQTMEGITIADMAGLNGTPETTLRRIIVGMIQRGIVLREGTGTSRSPHRYSLNAGAGSDVQE
jgi:hypothetical protein